MRISSQTPISFSPLTDPGAGPKEDSATPYPPEGAQLDLIIHRLKDDFFSAAVLRQEVLHDTHIIYRGNNSKCRKIFVVGKQMHDFKHTFMYMLKCFMDSYIKKGNNTSHWKEEEVKTQHLISRNLLPYAQQICFFFLIRLIKTCKSLFFK